MDLLQKKSLVFTVRKVSFTCHQAINTFSIRLASFSLQASTELSLIPGMRRASSMVSTSARLFFFFFFPTAHNLASQNHKAIIQNRTRDGELQAKEIAKLGEAYWCGTTTFSSHHALLPIVAIHDFKYPFLHLLKGNVFNIWIGRAPLLWRRGFKIIHDFFQLEKEVAFKLGPLNPKRGHNPNEKRLYFRQVFKYADTSTYPQCSLVSVIRVFWC